MVAWARGMALVLAAVAGGDKLGCCCFGPSVGKLVLLIRAAISVFSIASVFITGDFEFGVAILGLAGPSVSILVFIGLAAVNDVGLSNGGIDLAGAGAGSPIGDCIGL